MKYIEEVIEQVKKDNPDQPEFLQAVKEVLESLEPIISKNEEKYRSQKLLEKLVVPNNIVKFDVKWMDDKGKEQTNNQHRQQVINNYSRSKSVSFKSHFSSNPVIKNDPKVYHADTTTLNNFPLFYH